MALLPHEQATHLIQHATRTLVVLPPHASVDGQSSLVALGLLFARWQRPYDLFFPQTTPLPLPAFLPHPLSIQRELGPLSTLRIDVPLATTGAVHIEQQEKDGHLILTLVPAHGSWSQEEIRVQSGDDRYDLIIAIDCPDRATLHALASHASDLFQRTPIITIDHRATNEQWGHVNLIDVTALSTSQVIWQWIERTDPGLLETDLATCTLTGLIEQTDCFRDVHIDPRTLTLAARLMELGAKHGEIVRGLERTHSLASLKLWGAALEHLQQDPNLPLVWSVLTNEDFLRSNATSETLDGVFDRLIQEARDARVFAFITSSPEGVKLTLRTQLPYIAADIARLFGGDGTRDHATVLLPHTHDLVQTQLQIIDLIRQAMSRQT